MVEHVTETLTRVDFMNPLYIVDKSYMTDDNNMNSMNHTCGRGFISLT